ncbi:MAG TPA: hypothetical protein VFM05_06975, partial [Candidatus Saccharimonadales bacterium]|nr:hypothetical protein [Candidatus Saccharimonadales bacterium]
YAETPADARKNVVRKKQIQVAKDGTPGDIAHYHHKENEVEEWDEPCYFVEHRIEDQRGFSINEVRYVGRVVVPQCTADYLAWQESEHKRYEASIFRGKLNQRVAGVY